MLTIIKREVKTMLKKILHSFCALSVALMLFGIVAYAENDSIDVNNNTNKITQMAQNTDVDNSDDNEDTDWGWIGLVGLAGLLGLRRNDRRD